MHLCMCVGGGERRVFFLSFISSSLTLISHLCSISAEDMLDCLQQEVSYLCVFFAIFLVAYHLSPLFTSTFSALPPPYLFDCWLLYCLFIYLAPHQMPSTVIGSVLRASVYIIIFCLNVINDLLQSIVTCYIFPCR